MSLSSQSAFVLSQAAFELDGWVDTVWCNVVGRHDFVTITWREGYRLMTPQQRNALRNLAIRHFWHHALIAIVWWAVVFVCWKMRHLTFGATLLGCVYAIARAWQRMQIVGRLCQIRWRLWLS